MAWEQAIEEALKPGPTPRKNGSIFESWRTGQIIPARGRAKIPDDSGGGILKVYQPDSGRKQVVYVRLHKKESLDVLRMITKAVLLRASPRYEITYVSFYTPWALGEQERESKERLDPDRIKVWANSRLDLKPKPQLDITIYGLTVEDESILQALPFPPGAKVIGSWLDDNWRARWTIYRDLADRLYLEDTSPGETKPGETEELIEIPSLVGRRFEGKHSTRDNSINYYLIEEEGDFQIHFKDGRIWKAQAIR
jgi:hypothetical protein